MCKTIGQGLLARYEVPRNLPTDASSGEWQAQGLRTLRRALFEKWCRRHQVRNTATFSVKWLRNGWD